MRIALCPCLVLAATGLLAAARPAQADFFDDVRRTFQQDIPRTFEHDIPRAFGAEPKKAPASRAQPTKPRPAERRPQTGPQR